MKVNKEFSLSLSTMIEGDEKRSLKQSTSLVQIWTDEEIAKEMHSTCLEDENNFATAEATLYKRDGWTIEEVEPLLSYFGEITEEDKEGFRLYWSKSFKHEIENKEATIFKEEYGDFFIYYEYGDSTGLQDAVKNGDYQSSLEKVVEKINRWKGEEKSLEQWQEDFEIIKVKSIPFDDLVDAFNFDN